MCRSLNLFKLIDTQIGMSGFTLRDYHQMKRFIFVVLVFKHTLLIAAGFKGKLLIDQGIGITKPGFLLFQQNIKYFFHVHLGQAKITRSTIVSTVDGKVTAFATLPLSSFAWCGYKDKACQNT